MVTPGSGGLGKGAFNNDSVSRHGAAWYHLDTMKNTATKKIKVKGGGVVIVDVPRPWQETYSCETHGTHACEDPKCLIKGRFQSVKLR